MKVAASKISLSASEKISLISNLATLLSAGIPLLDAVTSIIQDSKGNPKKVLETLKLDLIQGKRISVSLSYFPRSFDKVTLNLIKASEEAGTLEVTLKDLKDHIQKEVEFIDKIKFALIYPILISLVFFGVMLVILIFVVPRIASVFKRLKVELPLPTQILVFVSDLLLKHTWWFLGSSAAFILIIVLIYKKNRRLLLEFISSLPLISRLVTEIDLTRFSRSLYLLLSSGLSITTALELTKDVVFKRQTSKIISQSREMILAGKRLSEGLRLGAHHSFPSIVLRLIEAGEKSGTLDKSMQDISVYLDYQVSNTLKTLTAVMEPLMLVIVGVSVGGMMLAIIAPIYGLIGQVGGR